MTKTEYLLSWRIRLPNGKTSEPVQARDIAQAMDLLNTRNKNNIQVMENGVWVWAL